MVVALDEVFHVIALGEIRADATLRVGGWTLAAFAHPHVYAVADLNLCSGEISAGNIERILRLHVATLSWIHVLPTTRSLRLPGADETLLQTSAYRCRYDKWRSSPVCL